VQNSLIQRAVTPIIERLGTSLAVYLVVTLGAEASLARDIGTGLVAACLVLTDFAVSKFIRKGA